jgi:hypothetical protein
MTMDARANTEWDKWDQLLTALGVASQLRLCIDDDGRSAAIIQLTAILRFFQGTAAENLTLPLIVLLHALRDLQDGTAKPARIFEPKRTKHRRRDDLVLRTTKVVAAVIMDQLHEHAKLSRGLHPVPKTPS